MRQKPVLSQPCSSWILQPKNVVLRCGFWLVNTACHCLRQLLPQADTLREMLEQIMDDEDELRELNLSSRPRREERRKQRERDRMERQLTRCVLIVCDAEFNTSHGVLWMFVMLIW